MSSYSGSAMPIRSVSRRMEPTNGELEMLRVLWQRGSSTVREVHQSLERATPVAYTTVLKLLQIMTEKGLVTRDASTRSHRYAAATAQDAAQRRMILDLAERAFGGSTLLLVLYALSTTPATAQGLDNVRRLLDKIVGGTS